LVTSLVNGVETTAKAGLSLFQLIDRNSWSASFLRQVVSVAISGIGAILLDV
jgi:Gpi18-like mannosyltransferase